MSLPYPGYRLPMLRKDIYKVGHPFQYPDHTEYVVSNATPRGTKLSDVEGAVVWGSQMFVQRYLQCDFNMNFFGQPRDQVIKRYKRRVDHAIGADQITYNHIGELHELGYLPIKFKTLPEGRVCPFKVPMQTIRNTDKHFGWLTNSLETLLSNTTWQGPQSATTALGFYRRFLKWAELTGVDPSFVKYQGHDFSMRGLPGIDAAELVGAGHLLSFFGTDTLPAIDFLEEYYDADCEEEIIGQSVNATEHSVMCMYGPKGEYRMYEELIRKQKPGTILAIVSDTYNLWRVMADFLPKLKPLIIEKDIKVTIRPDSGVPDMILCGDPEGDMSQLTEEQARAKAVGVIQSAWDTFGGEVNHKGYKTLDRHIGVIYGEAISPQMQETILRKLAERMFASSNTLMGIGSYTYQYVTRDTLGQAIKATYAERNGEAVPIFKKPITDNGTKHSAYGLLQVVDNGFDENGKPIPYSLKENVSWEEEDEGALITIFEDGVSYNRTNLKTVRANLELHV